VRAATTGGRPDSVATASRQPLNHGADEQGIQAAFSRAVLAAVEQYVNERIADGARRGERAGMVPVSPNGTAASERTVDRPRGADGETPHAVAERARIVGLDNEMNMVVLNAELKYQAPRHLVWAILAG